MLKEQNNQPLNHTRCSTVRARRSPRLMWSRCPPDGCQDNDTNVLWQQFQAFRTQLEHKHPLFLVDEAICVREGRTERCWRRLVQHAKRSWPECGPWTTSLTEKQSLWKRAYERASGNVTALLLVSWATVFSVSQQRTNTCFHSGSQGCLGIWATPGRKHHISLERTCSSRLPASRLWKTHTTWTITEANITFCSSGMSSLQGTQHSGSGAGDTLGWTARAGQYTFSGAGETAGLHVANACEADALATRGGWPWTTVVASETRLTR